MRTGADVVCFGYASVWGDEAVMKVVGGEEALFDGNDKAFAAQFDKRFKYFCWDKLCRRALYDGVRYPARPPLRGRLPRCPRDHSPARRRLLMLPDVLYYYRMRPTSITHVRQHGRLDQWLEAAAPLLELTRRRNTPSTWTYAWGRYNIIPASLVGRAL